MAKFQMKELVTQADLFTARLGSSGSSNWYNDKEVGKFVKLAAESGYALCAAGDPIEAYVSSVEPAPLDDYSIGALANDGLKEVTFDGDQATAGTGTVAIGDYVVCGTVVAKGTALSAAAKVCKATWQPGVSESANVSDVNEHLKVANYAWRVVSLGSVGTGAVGSTGVIKRMNG